MGSFLFQLEESQAAQKAKCKWPRGVQVQVRPASSVRGRSCSQLASTSGQDFFFYESDHRQLRRPWAWSGEDCTCNPSQIRAIPACICVTASFFSLPVPREGEGDGEETNSTTA